MKQINAQYSTYGSLINLMCFKNIYAAKQVALSIQKFEY